MVAEGRSFLRRSDSHGHTRASAHNSSGARLGSKGSSRGSGGGETLGQVAAAMDSRCVGPGQTGRRVMGTSPNGMQDNQKARSAESDGRTKPNGEASQPDWGGFAPPTTAQDRGVLPIPDRPFTGLITYDAKDPEARFPPVELYFCDDRNACGCDRTGSACGRRGHGFVAEPGTVIAIADGYWRQNCRQRTNSAASTITESASELCAPEGIRTPNLLIRSQMLYPLSYGRLSM